MNAPPSQFDRVIRFFLEQKLVVILLTLFIIPLTVQWWSVWYPGSEPGGGSYVAQRMLAARSERDALTGTLLFNVAHEERTTDFSEIGEILSEEIDKLEALSRGDAQVTGTESGFRDLDALTGGFQPGNLIVIAARPAMGKSTLALDFARACSIKHNLPSMIF